MNFRPILLCAVAMIFGSEPAWRVSADESLQTQLKSLDRQVAPAELRESLSRQVREDLSRQLQAANARSTAEWKAIRSLDDWTAYRRSKLDALKRSLGQWPTPGPLNLQITKSTTGDGFVIDNVLWESRPGWWVTANLYRPTTPRPSMPGLLICHAHHTPKEHGELQDMGMTWARAGCLVLVMDQVGHGERRQHPFATAADFSKPYRVGHADYSFRFDSTLQLQLVGESLMGWMVWDLMRGVDLLLAQPGIDSQRLILLGAVAGGGDPAAVAGALDERIAAVVPFNFGGPQPETRYPLPDDAETWFGYAGSGSWESTRNLTDSAARGFLPWVIVGGVAPRRLIYAHEFNWDQARDPVWKRLQTIFDWHGHADFLDHTNGRGAVTGSSTEDTHCTHIGRVHRRRIHDAFQRWFGITVTPDTEFSQRIPSEQLRCWTPEWKSRLQPKSLSQMTSELGTQRLAASRKTRANLSNEAGRTSLQNELAQRLGPITPEKLGESRPLKTTTLPNAQAETFLLATESGTRLPVLLIAPQPGTQRQTVVVTICSQGFARLLETHNDEVAALIASGHPVCLFDPRGLGESSLGSSHGRRSSATSLASTALMLGTPLLGQQLRDVRSLLSWLRTHPATQGRAFALWGESLVPPNANDANFHQPRDDDQALPPVSEPQAPLVALLTGVFEEDVKAIRSVNGLASWQPLLNGHLTLVARDPIVPGLLATGDIADWLTALPTTTAVSIESPVDGLNRSLDPRSADQLLSVALRSTNKVTASPTRNHSQSWLARPND